MAGRSAAKSAVAERGRLEAGPDPQEQEALADAGKMLAAYMAVTPRADPEIMASVAISGWICSRSRQVVSQRLREAGMLKLGNSKLRGWVEGALPLIGAALADLPSDVAFFDLPKESVVDVFVAGMEGARAAAVAAGEASAFPFDDPIPFGDDYDAGDAGEAGEADGAGA